MSNNNNKIANETKWLLLTIKSTELITGNNSVNFMEMPNIT